MLPIELDIKVQGIQLSPRGIVMTTYIGSHPHSSHDGCLMPTLGGRSSTYLPKTSKVSLPVVWIPYYVLYFVEPASPKQVSRHLHLENHDPKLRFKLTRYRASAPSAPSAVAAETRSVWPATRRVEYPVGDRFGLQGRMGQ
jgi:hypothetical protein